MASIEDIVNIGLVSLGESPVASLSGQQTRQLVANALYGAAKRALLSEINWRFATTHQDLARQSGTPVDTRYTYQYSLPIDPKLLQVQHLEPNGSYVIQGNLLLSNATELLMTYTADVKEDLMPAYFVQLLGLRMAEAMAMPLTKKVTRLKAMTTLYDRYLPTARFADSSQQPNPEIQSQPFIDARF